MKHSCYAAAIVAGFLVTMVQSGWAGVDEPVIIDIPSGPFVRGSDRVEREAAYRLDEAAYRHSRTRKWKW